MDQRDLRIKLASFEGPMDLLLYLIRQNEIDISQINISEITDQYLRMIDLMRELNLDIAGEFLLMASTLVLIKSRKLLPQDEQASQEVFDEIDSEEELRRKLLEHQRISEVAREFKAMPRMGWDFFKRPEPDEKAKRATELKEMDISDLTVAFQGILLKEARPVRVLKRETVSVADAAEKIAHLLRLDEAVELETLLTQAGDRGEIVAIFLAILEMGRLRRVRVMQHITYGTIYIVLREAIALDAVAELFATGDSYAYSEPSETSN